MQKWQVKDHFDLHSKNVRVIMKMHCMRSDSIRALISKFTLLGTPGTALAMGGEGLAEDFLRLLFWFVVWLVAAVDSFTFKTEPWTISRFVLWGVRLSFPAWFVWLYVKNKYI
jgi:hypothetical protein